MTISLRNTQEREAAAQRAKVERANHEEADWRLYCADPEGARQRAAAERAQREGVIYRQQQADWSAFWQTIDQRVAEAVAAQYSFTKDQQELLFDILKDARDATRAEVVKAIGDVQTGVDARFETLERRVRAPGALPPVKTWRQGEFTKANW
jgi:ethanolamine utilization cobalamin adenosyltransferase